MAITNVIADYWMNDGDTPSTILDHSGNNYHLTVSGSLSQVAGPAGGNLTGYEFEDSQYVYHADSSNDFLQGLEELSVFAAITADNDEVAGDMEIVSKLNCFRIMYRPSSNWLWVIANSSQALYTALPVVLDSTGGTTWHGLFVTIELGTTQEANVYIDTSPATIENPESLPQTSLNNTADDFFVGARSAGSTTWDGRISRVLLKNGIFTEAERTELLTYTVDLGGATPSYPGITTSLGISI